MTEILQSIRQSEMSPILDRIYHSEGGTELIDVLMKYMYVNIHFKSWGDLHRLLDINASAISSVDYRS